MKRINTAIASVLISSVLFVSCFDKSDKTVKGPLPEKTVNGSVLNLCLDSTVETLDAQIAVYATSFEIIGACIEGLKKTNPDGSISNALCAEQTLSPDGLTYTFKLRQDAYWSNGDPVTAHDFVYAWQRGIDPATESEYAFLFSDIAQIKNSSAIMSGQMEPNQLGVRALDDYTLQVELQVPVSFFEKLLNFSTFFPANQKFIEAMGDKYGTSPETYLCNSAFVLTEYEPEAKSIKLTKNTAYYDADKIKIAGLHYTYEDDSDAMLAKYNSGKLDLIEISSKHIPEYQNSKEFHLIDTGFMYYISVNFALPYLRFNKYLRKALTLAFDRQALVDYLADGSKPAWTAVPAGYAFDKNGVDFSKKGVEFEDDCAYRPDLAREYLAKAKEQAGQSTFTIKFTFSDTKFQNRVVDNIIEQIETNLPGVHIEKVPVNNSERRKIMARGEYELGLTNWGPDYADPMTYLSMWMTGNDNNTGNFRNPTYDSIIANCLDGDLCTKPDERWTALKEAEKIIMDNAVIMPVFSQCNTDLLKSNVTGISFHAVGVSKIYRNAEKK